MFYILLLNSAHRSSCRFYSDYIFYSYFSIWNSLMLIFYFIFQFFHYFHCCAICCLHFNLRLHFYYIHLRPTHFVKFEGRNFCLSPLNKFIRSSINSAEYNRTILAYSLRVSILSFFLFSHWTWISLYRLLLQAFYLLLI